MYTVFIDVHESWLYDIQADALGGVTCCTICYITR
jgi:hypothetical protein